MKWYSSSDSGQLVFISLTQRGTEYYVSRNVVLKHISSKSCSRKLDKNRALQKYPNLTCKWSLSD